MRVPFRDDRETKAPSGLRPRGARLALRGVSWVSGGQRIVEAVDLDVAPGEMVGLIGPNGSGKSSVLRCVYRHQRPGAGTVALDGADVWAMSAADCARRMAVVLQEFPAEFGLRVTEVVAMGRTPHKHGFDGDTAQDRRIIDRALATMDLDMLAGRTFETLSGGEKQRALIARALAQEPRLIVLDEPTNHLDIRHQLELMQRLRGLGISVLTTVHDLNLAAGHCDRLYLLRRGRVLAEGTPDAVLTPSRIEDAFGVPTLVDRHPTTHRPRITLAARPIHPPSDGPFPCA